MIAVVLQKIKAVVSNICFFTPILGEDSYFDTCFSNGLVQPPTRESINHDKSPLNHHLEEYFSLFQSPLNQHFEAFFGSLPSVFCCWTPGLVGSPDERLSVGGRALPDVCAIGSGGDGIRRKGAFESTEPAWRIIPVSR